VPRERVPHGESSWPASLGYMKQFSGMFAIEVEVGIGIGIGIGAELESEVEVVNSVSESASYFLPKRAGPGGGPGHFVKGQRHLHQS